MGAREMMPTAPEAPATAWPPHTFIPRARVQAFLEEVPSYAATLVVAPAGWGKTAAVAAYSERAGARGVPVVWVRSDRVDPVRAALEQAVPGTATVLVVDDAHLLPDDGAAALADQLSHRAADVHLVLVSRHELAWVPVSALLDGSVRQLPIDDLRFSGAEATALVRAHFPDADDRAVEAVLQESDGWAAALVLGARVLRGSGNQTDGRALLTARRGPILDYLLHEVVDSLSPALVRVLLTTCQLDRVTPEEALLLSGDPDAGDLLTRAAADGLLVTGYRDRTGGGSGWRFHPLLLDLLRRRTGPDGPDRPVAVEAHSRAAREYADRRDAGRALLHARLSGDPDLQLWTLREFAGDLIVRGDVSPVAEALAAVPAETRSQHRDLLVLHASVLRRQGHLDAAKVAADRALAADAGTDPPVSRDGECDLAVLHLWQARYGWRDATPALERARRVLGCRHDGRVSTHDLAGLSALRAHWLVLELASFETWLGDLDLAAIHLQDATTYVTRVDLPVLERAVLAQRAVLELLLGAYQTALTSADAAADLRRFAPELPDVTDARVNLARGWAAVQSLELDLAAEALEALSLTPRELLDPLLLVQERLLRACLLTMTGAAEEARRLLDGHGDVPERLPVTMQGADLMIRMLIEVTMGDLAALERKARRLRDVPLSPVAGLCEALAVGLAGEEARAVRILDALADDLADAPAVLGLVVAVVRVAFLDRIGTAGARSAALDLVPDLLSRAAPQRMLCILTLGPVISPRFLDLVAEHRAGAQPHPFAAEAHAALGRYPRPYPDLTPHRGVAAPPPVVGDADRQLTPRELVVLEELALGGGNGDLARALFVSENTVKTHLASIYRKLGVQRRADALHVARARGLI